MTRQNKNPLNCGFHYIMTNPFCYLFLCVRVCSLSGSDFANSQALSLLILLLQTGQDFSMLLGFLFHVF